MNMRIFGLGTAVPVHRMSQQEALDMSADIICRDERQRRLMRMLFRKAGVENRHTVVPHAIAFSWVQTDTPELVHRGPSTRERMLLYAEHAPPLAHAASRQAMQSVGIEARDVTHLITVSCTGFGAPGVDISLIESLRLRPTVQRVHVGYMGCHGAINGLRVARGIALADPAAVVLLCAVELCSLHYRFSWDDEGIIGNALFADGSAALVAAAQNGHGRDHTGWTLRDTGSCLLPGTRDVMSWSVGDHGFEMRLTSDVAEAIGTHLRPWLSEWLATHGLSIDAVGSWAVHPGGPRILDAVENALDLGAEQTADSRRILADYGNMSSPTVLFILDRLSRGPQTGPCVLLGFGPGMTAEVALLA